MKYLLFFSLLIIGCSTAKRLDVAEKDEHQKEILAHQKYLNGEYKDSLESPLKNEDRLVFEGLNFYAINPDFRILAQFKEKSSKVFKMETTTDRAPEYRKYGELTFKLQGKNFKLNLYQNIKLIERAGYEDYLFLPFTDPTNGKESYGGGRYIDFRIPKDKEVVLDFNKAYNPYCAYNGKYSCPIPPPENDISIGIEAGVKAWSKH
jgi:uncharacterized protein (DUF1684 family)